MEVADVLRDRRIRCVRLDRNMGRGFARGVALEAARGDLVTMLDADDWMYQDRLQKQAELLHEFPDATLVDSGVAIVDTANELRGVVRRGQDDVPVLKGPFRRLGHLPVASHASCMIRAPIARQAGFDPTLPRCEDQDFLFRVLMGRRYISWGRVHYVYSGFKKLPLKEILLAYECQDRVLSRYNCQFPLMSRVQRLRVKLKTAVRKMSHCFEDERFLSLRYQRPTQEDTARFEASRKIVTNFVEQRFGLASGHTGTQDEVMTVLASGIQS